MSISIYGHYACFAQQGSGKKNGLLIKKAWHDNSDIDILNLSPLCSKIAIKNSNKGSLNDCLSLYSGCRTVFGSKNMVFMQ